jgi:molecular chaperone GrpE
MRRNDSRPRTAPPSDPQETGEFPPEPEPDATGETAAPPVDAGEQAKNAGGYEDSGSLPVDMDALSRRHEAAVEEERDKFLRLAAEFDNYRRRATRERAEAGARAQAELVAQLIEALDDIARFAHLDPQSTDAATVVQGAEMVERKLMKALTAAGLEIVDPLDQQFDPERQEAVATEPAGSREDDHTIARVYQPGYVFKGQLLRPARVVVRQWSG